MENQNSEEKSINQSNSQSNKKKPFFKIGAIVIVLVLILVTVGLLVKGKPLQNGTATLSWNANTESNLTGYRIYYGTSPRTDKCPPGGYPQNIDAGKTNTPEKPSYTINNLEEGQSYYFSITSYNSAQKESCFSDEVNKTIAKSSATTKLIQRIKGIFGGK